jgi:hypothetical protein
MIDDLWNNILLVLENSVFKTVFIVRYVPKVPFVPNTPY